MQGLECICFVLMLSNFNVAITEIVHDDIRKFDIEIKNEINNELATEKQSSIYTLKPSLSNDSSAKNDIVSTMQMLETSLGTFNLSNIELIKSNNTKVNIRTNNNINKNNNTHQYVDENNSREMSKQNTKLSAEHDLPSIGANFVTYNNSSDIYVTDYSDCTSKKGVAESTYINISYIDKNSKYKNSTESLIQTKQCHIENLFLRMIKKDNPFVNKIIKQENIKIINKEYAKHNVLTETITYMPTVLIADGADMTVPYHVESQCSAYSRPITLTATNSGDNENDDPYKSVRLQQPHSYPLSKCNPEEMKVVKRINEFVRTLLEASEKKDVGKQLDLTRPCKEDPVPVMDAFCRDNEVLKQAMVDFMTKVQQIHARTQICSEMPDDLQQFLEWLLLDGVSARDQLKQYALKDHHRNLIKKYNSPLAYPELNKMNFFEHFEDDNSDNIPKQSALYNPYKNVLLVNLKKKLLTTRNQILIKEENWNPVVRTTQLNHYF